MFVVYYNKNSDKRQLQRQFHEFREKADKEKSDLQDKINTIRNDAENERREREKLFDSFPMKLEDLQLQIDLVRKDVGNAVDGKFNDAKTALLNNHMNIQYAAFSEERMLMHEHYIKDIDRINRLNEENRAQWSKMMLDMIRTTQSLPLATAINAPVTNPYATTLFPVCYLYAQI